MEEIGGYHLVRRLGSGGMGSVWEARDAEGRAVAFKLIHPHIAGDWAARERLVREIDLLRRIAGRGVVRVLDAEIEATEAFVVTELIDGPTLEEDVLAHGPFAPDELATLAGELADALREIHNAGVVHRDLKPSNVMLSHDGPVIIDFGISQAAEDARLTQAGLVTGTPGYLDPAVLAGADPDDGADWWAWAAVLAFAGTGRHPFGSGSSAAVLARVNAGMADLAGIPAQTAAALAGAMRPNPALRIAPEQVVAALEGRENVTAVLDPPAQDGYTAVLGNETTVLGTQTKLLPEYGNGGWGAGDEAGYPGGEASYSGDEWGFSGDEAGHSGEGARVPGLDDDLDADSRGATRPRAGLVVLSATGALLAVVGGLWPGWALIILVGFTVAAASLGVGATARWRAQGSGRNYERVRAVAASPWHLLQGIALTAATLGLGLALGYLMVWLLAAVAPAIFDPPGPAALAAGFLVAVIAAWAIPLSRPARLGASLLLGALLPGRAARVTYVLVGFALAGLGVFGIVNGDFALADWAPMPGIGWPN